jgi:hypothetical protein
VTERPTNGPAALPARAEIVVVGGGRNTAAVVLAAS